MNTQLEQLEILSKHPDLIKEIEDYITSSKIPKKNFPIPSEFGRYKRELIKSYSIILLNWSIKYKIPEKCINLYITMDKSFNSYIGYNWSSQEEIFNLNHQSIGINYFLTGSDLINVYSDKKSNNVVKILEKYIELFPTSTKKYIKNKQIERKKSIRLTKITNHFEYKIFLGELPKEYKKTYLLDVYKNIKQEDTDKVDLVSTTMYFYKGVKEKYKSIESEKLQKDILNGLMISFKLQLKRIFKPSIMKQPPTIEFLKNWVIKKESNKEFTNHFINEIITSYPNQDLIFYLSFLTTREEQEIQIKKMILNDLREHIYYENVFELLDCAIKLQDLIIEESRKQYYLKNKELNFKSFLTKGRKNSPTSK